VSIPSSHDGLVGFNSVLAAHLLSVDAGHGQAAIATCITRRWACNALLHRQM
jgi:hypothetical protein